MKTIAMILSVVIFSLFTTNLFAQKPNVEWGEIPRSDLEMTSYPSDTNATALVLYDYGESKFNDDLDIVFTRHQRVKIFTQKGFKWGTYSIGVRTGDGDERLVEIEGCTYSLNDKNEITTTEFDDDEVFEDKATDNVTYYKFTLPALKPECIIEVRYKIVSTNLYDVKDWTFQKDEPVRWSEYKFIFPRALGYSLVKLGYENWAFEETKEVKQNFSGPAYALLGTTNANCWDVDLAVKDIPALRDEPFITTLKDYANELQIQLSGYAFANGVRRQFFTDWKMLVEELSDSKNVGDAIDVTGDVEDLEKSITKGLTNPLDKMKAIYQWVTKSIVWNGLNRFYKEQDVDDVIEYKKGNSAEITFLFLSLLKSANIEAYPVILSTRDNGKIQILYPIVNQFNYVIAQVKIDSTTYLVDATSPLRSYDLLPSKVLNTRGLVIKPDTEEWISINSNKKNIDYSLTAINVNEDGSINGRLEDSYGEYNSLSIRRKLESKKDIEIANDLLDAESKGLTIDSVLIENKDSLETSLKLNSYISSDSYCQKNGDLIYINPCLVHRLKENPFKSKVRKFEIDYGFQNGDISIIDIAIPKGYELKEKLDNKKILVENVASFSRISGLLDDNKFQIIIKMEIKSSIVSPNYYSQLKAFYANIVDLEAEQIVIGPKLKASENLKGTDKKNGKGNNN